MPLLLARAFELGDDDMENSHQHQHLSPSKAGYNDE